jgi:hydrogenase-4 membrane subunit HyfE
MFSIDTEAGESELGILKVHGAHTSVLMYFVNSILSVLAVLAVILYSTPGESAHRNIVWSIQADMLVFAVALFFIAIMYWVVGLLYITTSREIKRFDVSP